MIILMRYFLIVLSLILVCACGSQAQTSARTNASLATTGQTDWLHDKPCRLPCFQGVTPGETTLTDTVTIIQQNSMYDGQAAIIEPHSIRVPWKSDPRAVTNFMITTQKLTPQTVEFISTGTPSLALTEVIRAFGEPSHIVALKYMSLSEYDPSNVLTSYDLVYIYQDRGMILDTATIPYNTKPDFTPTVKVLGPKLVPPTQESINSYFLNVGIAQSLIQPWQGWKDFDFYCRDTATGAPCQP